MAGRKVQIEIDIDELADIITAFVVTTRVVRMDAQSITTAKRFNKMMFDGTFTTVEITEARKRNKERA